MIDVSVIFVNYNTVGCLCDAIDSVIRLTADISYEIIVVDNHSSDNSQLILSERYGNRIRYLALNENIGFGRANNEGIRLSGGRHIFLLNPDTLLMNNAIRILSGYLDANPRAGVAGGNLYDAQGNPAVSYELHLPSVWGMFRPALCGNRYFNHTGADKKVGYISGADMMIRRSVLESAGGFDADFFMYAEEAELSSRISAAGYDSISVPAAKIIHLEGKSFEFSEKRALMQFEGRSLYFRKRYGRSGERRYHLISRYGAWIRKMIFTILNRRSHADYWANQLRVIKTVSSKI